MARTYRTEPRHYREWDAWLRGEGKGLTRESPKDGRYGERHASSPRAKRSVRVSRDRTDCRFDWGDMYGGLTMGQALRITAKQQIRNALAEMHEEDQNPGVTP